MCEYLKNLDAWVSLIALFLSLIAIFQTKKEISLSNKQSLFDKRIANYSVVSSFLNVYEKNGTMLEPPDRSKPFCSITATFPFITSSDLLADMGNAFDNPFNTLEARLFSQRCEHIQQIAEEIPLLFNGQEADLIKIFVEKYTEVLIAMLRYRVIEKKAEDDPEHSLLDEPYTQAENKLRKDLLTAIDSLKTAFDAVEKSNARQKIVSQIRLI